MTTAFATRHPRTVVIGRRRLEGFLAAPTKADGLVVFAHGSGSSRLSPRNAYVAERLNRRGFGTLLFDLLTNEEARERANVFDIPLLAERVMDVVRWCRAEGGLSDLPVGLFGASTGAAAALVAAARMPQTIAAVVSRGGRPDLARAALGSVRAPTLLIVGGADHVVLGPNQDALAALTCQKSLRVVPEATHLFEEPGALDEVVEAAAAWFEAHLGRTNE